MRSELIGFTVMAKEPLRRKHPIEDFYSLDSERRIAVVADGVTRDDSTYSPDRKTADGARSFFDNYSSPSPAADVAKIFSVEAMRYLQNCDSFTSDSVRDAFDFANEAIGRYNSEKCLGTHYGLNDLAGCVASIAVIEGSALHWGYVCDAGVSVLGSDLGVKFKTNDDGNQDSVARCAAPGIAGLDRRTASARNTIKRRFRNRSAEDYSFGVINGESGAMDFVRVGSMSLGSDDRVLVYSDGAEEVIFDVSNRINRSYAELIRGGNWEKLEEKCCDDVPFEGTLCFFP
jgi:hypothetical protein